MKRANGLFEKVLSYQNLLWAFRKAYQGCSSSYEAMRFSFNLEKELISLKNNLQDCSYRPGGFRIFRVHDPKERTISVAPFRDRVVHHAVVNVLEPVYERVFIHDSYATRKGKGTHNAILRVQQFLRKNDWYLRADIRKFFDSVDHDLLINVLHRKLKDMKLLKLLEVIIRAVPNNKGLPIGNLTSQFLANVYLDPLDHYMKDHLGIKHYVRYMDDFVLLSNEKEYLKNAIFLLREFLHDKLRLELKQGAVYINKQSNGIGFLGARIFPRFLRIKKKTLQRGLSKFAERYSEYTAGAISEDRFVASATSIMGHIAFFKSHALRLSCGQALNFWREPCHTGRQLEQQTAECSCGES